MEKYTPLLSFPHAEVGTEHKYHYISLNIPLEISKISQIDTTR